MQVSPDVPITKQRNADKVDAPDAFEAAAVAFDGSVADVPRVLRDLFAATKFAQVVGRLPEHHLDAGAIAETMVAVENQPMVSNNCRVPDDDERRQLAAATVEAWHRLRAAA